MRVHFDLYPGPRCGQGNLLRHAALFVLALIVMAFPAWAEEYLIGEGDLLRISVYDNPDLATDARVGGGRQDYPAADR